LKLRLPVNPTPVTLVVTIATQVTVSGADEFLSATLPKLYGDEQFNGRLTGEPKAYRLPVVVPRYTMPFPNTGRVNFVTPGALKLLTMVRLPPDVGGMAL
jgi:hypothetical protein